MKLIDCSPFVRFVYRIRFIAGKPAVAKDNRLFYITEGEGTIIINKKEYKFSPGTIILWQAGDEYYITHPHEVKLVSFNFDYTPENNHMLDPFAVLNPEDQQCRAIKENQVVFEDCPMLNSPLVCTSNAAIHNLIEKILLENTACQPYYRERISALLKECLVLIARSVYTLKDTRSDGALETIIEYVHKNYNTDIDNTFLAKLVGYHPYYLNKLFRCANGVTLHKYVINYRISIGEQLLLSGNASIEEIALKTGFNSSLSFTSSFKKKNGITPTEFRKKFGASL